MVGGRGGRRGFNIGEEIDDGLSMYGNELLSRRVKVGGLGGIWVGCGEWKGGGIGLELIGKGFDEKMLYGVGYEFERE